ncbi:MAG TPA: hypothetical protein ENI73_00595 [Spirochaetes bacterium]|nr:hypothetical protein [Spirochaetota bacterium]
MKNPIGTRATAMGGAFVAVADDPSAIFHNPAGLATLEWSYLSLHLQKIPLNKYSGTISLVSPPDKTGKWAYGFAGRFQTGLGIQGYDAVGNKTKKLTNYSNAAYFSIARKFGKLDNFSLGVNLKGIYEKLDSIDGYGGGMDVGALIKVSFLNIGVMVEDVFTVEKFTSRNELIYYDRILKMGVSTNLSKENIWKISVQIDKNLSTSNKAIFRVGGYFKLWQGKGDIDYSLENLRNFEDDNFEKNFDKIIKDPKKEFKEELFFNIGFGGGNLGLGWTLKIWGVKFDLASSFPELDWDKTNVLFTLDIPY